MAKLSPLRSLSLPHRFAHWVCRALLAFVLVAATLPGPTLASAQRSAEEDAARTALRNRVQGLLTDARLGDGIGIAIVDTESGDVLFEQNGAVPRNPASNMKLITAAAALKRLGARYTMTTSVHGSIERGTVRRLIIRGTGDPDLRASHLYELAQDLVDRGVQRVGSVVIDGSYFDDQILPPAFEQQPRETASFRAAVGALAVDRAAFVLRVMPADAPGQAAQVRLRGAAYFDLDADVGTSAAGEAPNVIASQQAQSERMRLVLRGSVPAGILGVSYRRRVENPLFHAGHIFNESLKAAGIQTRDRVVMGEAGETNVIVRHRSQPLSQLLHAVGKWSDNFSAEMLLKVIAAESGGEGSSALGAQLVTRTLSEMGVPTDDLTIVNGSGLFTGNQVTPNQLTQLLRLMYRDPSVRSEYVAQLAIGSRDGTLRNRLRRLPARGIVRAKTGTLNDVIALSGYVLGPVPERTVAFSVLCNGIRGKQGKARRLADAIATAIANYAHGGTH